MRPRRQEPRRVPKTPAAKPGERAGAGCLGLLVLPWFLFTLLGTFLSAGAPLIGTEWIMLGGFNLAVLLPLAIVLGSVSLSAISRALGSNEPIQLAHRAAAGVGVSAMLLFLVAAVIVFAGSVGMVPIFALAGVLAMIGVMAASIRRAAIQNRPQRKRRKHQGVPKPPWTHPLARTERVNMYGEALADQFNVMTVLAAAALSLVLQNPMPLLTVGGLELFWLALVPDSAWFRERVERKHKAMAHEQAQTYREEQREFLASDQLERHREVVANVDRAIETIAAAGFPFDEQKLQRAVDHHLWLMQLENYYSDLDIPTRIRELEEQVAAAEADTQGMSGRMLEVLQKRLEVLRQRHRQAHQLNERLLEITDKRRNLEQTMLLVTESALAGSQTFDEIDEVLTELQVTEEVVLDLHDEEYGLEEEIEAAYAQSVESAARA